ncbi:ArsR family transcriptional regulator [Verrucosispora sp. WMMD1129]|uniref:arsenate reductase/protein-tyrosine-phosphatase family protein n=1 Tax=Verrucosispora sp. WMMD1129 TaxID=3016093 RepID=UPI00249C6235|nr:ArsR family transcriptional regulator [Verrucosispora sp. WMMD1129]WFE47493.1 ArsR family transcriptional regulator [Verrucosispora sp. WMMD1129]
MASSGRTTPSFLHLAAHPLRWQLLTELATGDLRVRELVALVGEPQNLVSYHLRLLRDGGLVSASRSSFDGRDSYYHLDLDSCALALAEAGRALHPALLATTTPPPVDRRRSRKLSVLFVCTGNSARSPIAEALLLRRSGGEVRVVSAGTRPRSGLHPHAVRVLRDSFGVDVAGQRPRHLDTVARRRYDYVITMCDKAREVCPDLPHEPRRVHWSIPDPATTADYPAFHRVAIDIDIRVRHLLPVLTAARSAKEIRL